MTGARSNHVGLENHMANVAEIELDEIVTPNGDLSHDFKVGNEIPESPSETGTRTVTFKDDGATKLIFGADDKPSYFLSTMFALQHVFLSIGSTVTVPLLVANSICAENDEHVKAKLVNTFLFICGISTIIQTFVGCRLPIIQGGSQAFLPAIVASMALERWRCPDIMSKASSANYLETTPNASSLLTVFNGALNEQSIPAWQIRIREIQGAAMAASVVEILIGLTGVVSLLVNYIGPITIIPTITLIGLSLYDVAAKLNSHHWGMAALTLVLLFLFSLYLAKIKVPLPALVKRKKKELDEETDTNKKRCGLKRYHLFKLLPVILTIALAWSINTIIVSKTPDSVYAKRTRAKLGVVKNAPIFYMPYPGQFGMPSLSAGIFVGMLVATIKSIIESVGDYYACAKICSLPPPPRHTINRGIMVEGFGVFMSGIFGAGGSITSFSQNIGAIGFTKVASRRVFGLAGLIFIICGVFGKVGAVLTAIPDPILGAIVTLSFAMVATTGLSYIQFININSIRNQTILGVALFSGLMIPAWLKSNENSIKTGSEALDQIIFVLLSNPMFIGGVTGFVLDNTAPGTLKERGMIEWRKQIKVTEQSIETEQDSPLRKHSDLCTQTYDIPLITKRLKNWRWTSYIPISPTFHRFIGYQLLRRIATMRNSLHLKDRFAFHKDSA